MIMDIHSKHISNILTVFLALCITIPDEPLGLPDALTATELMYFNLEFGTPGVLYFNFNLLNSQCDHLLSTQFQTFTPSCGTDGWSFW